MEALLIAGRDRGPGRFPGPHLFLDAFEDDDVRIGRDSDREDQAGEAGQRQRDVEDEDRRVHERDVDGETGDGHDPQQPVEDDEEERDDEQADDARRSSPPASESLPSVAETSVRSICSKETGRAPVWSTSARSFASPSVPMFSICAEPPPMPSESVRFVRVDLRPGPDLPVEHDGEVLRDAAEVAALPQPPRDVLEAVLPLARELHADDRLAELVEVVAGARRLEVAAGHLGHRVLGVVRLVAEEVVVRPSRASGWAGRVAPRWPRTRRPRRRLRRRAPCRRAALAGSCV